MILPHYPRLVSPDLLDSGAQGHLCGLRVPLRSAAQPRHHAGLHTTTEVVAGVSGAPAHPHPVTSDHTPDTTHL